jgi:CheY-like chemotaxis protein
LAIALREMGYTVAGEIASGEEALEKMPNLRPDLILMDIVLDGEMDGIEAARQVRSRWDTPVVFLTAHADHNTLRRARLAEPFGYVIKPFAEAELHATLEMALYKHKVDSKIRKMELGWRPPCAALATACLPRTSRPRHLSQSRRGAAHRLEIHGSDRAHQHRGARAGQ